MNRQFKPQSRARTLILVASLALPVIVLLVQLLGVPSMISSALALGEAGYEPAAQQSRTGPQPPPEVLAHDAQKPADRPQDIQSEVTLPVPAYEWRHGCGPTAAGMVVGYFDSLGFEDLVPGSAATQTEAVDQAIASGGNSAYPEPPGSELHYEDYAYPVDTTSTGLLPDDYITQGRDPHEDDCLADYMNTSRSTSNNYYGWSWSFDMDNAFVDYVNQQNAAYAPVIQGYTSYNGTMTWDVLTGEIDAGRPMVFLVDSNGDNSTDHFVTIIGYRTSPTLQYGAWDTWSTTTVRWENFSPIATDTDWGIWGGWSFDMGILLNVAKDGNGSGIVTSDPAGIDCGSICQSRYVPDTVVTLTATADGDTFFAGWSGDCTNSSGPCVVPMSEAKAVTATFSSQRIFLPFIDNGLP